MDYMKVIEPKNKFLTFYYSTLLSFDNVGVTKLAFYFQIWNLFAKEIGSLQINLVEVGIEVSNISGTLPLNIFNLSSLQILSLWCNNLSGSLSRDIANLTTLEHLDL